MSRELGPNIDGIRCAFGGIVYPSLGAQHQWHQVGSGLNHLPPLQTNRVIRACVELGPNNPIISVHDQGAGGR